MNKVVVISTCLYIAVFVMVIWFGSLLQSVNNNHPCYGKQYKVPFSMNCSGLYDCGNSVCQEGYVTHGFCSCGGCCFDCIRIVEVDNEMDERNS